MFVYHNTKNIKDKLIGYCIFQVIEFIGKENVHLSAKQLDELIDLIDKEETLEVEDKIERALQKEKETKSLEKKQKEEPPKKEGKPPGPPDGPGSGTNVQAQPETVANAQQPQKPKVDDQKFVTPLPVSSIDPAKPKDLSKAL